MLNSPPLKEESLGLNYYISSRGSGLNVSNFHKGHMQVYVGINIVEGPDFSELALKQRDSAQRRLEQVAEEGKRGCWLRTFVERCWRFRPLNVKQSLLF